MSARSFVSVFTILVVAALTGLVAHAFPPAGIKPVPFTFAGTLLMALILGHLLGKSHNLPYLTHWWHSLAALGIAMLLAYGLREMAQNVTHSPLAGAIVAVIVMVWMADGLAVALSNDHLKYGSQALPTFKPKPA